MNIGILDIIVLVFTLLLVLHGWRKGFADSLFTMLSLVVAIFLVSVSISYVRQGLEDLTPVRSGLEKKFDDLAEDSFRKLGINMQKSQEGDGWEISEAEKDRLIENMKIPKFVQMLLKENVNSGNRGSIMLDTFLSTARTYVVDLFMNVLAFLVTWVLVLIALWLAGKLLKLLVSLPGLRLADHILGAGFGLFQSLAIVLVLMVILALAAKTQTAQQILAMIKDSILLHRIYDWNPLLRLLEKLLGR